MSSETFQSEIIDFIKTETPVLHQCLQRIVYQDVYTEDKLDEILSRELNSFWNNLHPNKKIGIMVKETCNEETGHLTLFHAPSSTEQYMLDVSKDKVAGSANIDIVWGCPIDLQTTKNNINALRLKWAGAVEVSLCWWWDDEKNGTNNEFFDENLSIDDYNGTLDNLILRPSIHYPEIIISTHLFGEAANFNSFCNYYDFQKTLNLEERFNAIQKDSFYTFQEVIYDMIKVANYTNELLSLITQEN